MQAWPFDGGVIISAAMETKPMGLKENQLSASHILSTLAVPKREIKFEPQDMKSEPQEATCHSQTVKLESSQEDQEVKFGVIHIKTELLENSSGPKNESREDSYKFQEDQCGTRIIKSEPNDGRNEPQSVKCETLDVDSEQEDSTSGLVIESTSTLRDDEYPADDKTSLNSGGVVETWCQVKKEVVIKEEKIETNIQKIKQEEIAVESVSTASAIHEVNPPITDSGSKKTEGTKKSKSARPRVMIVNPKWKAKNQVNTKGDDRTVVNDSQHVMNVVIKSEQPGCDMKGSMEGNAAQQAPEVPREYPVVWVDVKEEKEDHEVELTGMGNDDTDEEKNIADDPDWQLDDTRDGIDFVQNINKLLANSIKTEVRILGTPKVQRGPRKRRKMDPDELMNELLDGQVLSPEQAELLLELRSRMDFADPTTLSYSDGLKCHMCLVCAYKTHVPAHMVKHVRCHTGDKPYTCSECDYRSAESSSMATHMRTHTGEKPYACPHCDYRTNGSSILKTHIMIHTGKKPLSCPHCDFKCREHGGLKRHIRTHTGEKPFACPHCDYRGPSSTCLKSHIMVHTREKPHVCNYCGYATACSSTLTIHLRRHTGEKPYCCTVCSYKFVTSGSLKVHMRTHTGEKPYLCKICGYSCATQGRFKSHLRIHSGDKKHECPFCDYKSVRSDNLKIHLRTHTGERPYSCPHCEYRSSEKARLIQHIRIHTGEKPYACSTCGFKTSDRNGLRSHNRVHSSEKPFCCSHCDFKTARRGVLKNHIMRHTGIRPYACPYCPYKCTKSCSLKGHVANNHTGNKKFWCGEKGCNYRAVIASGLKLHMRKHSKSKPFKCELCPYEGRQENDLKGHVKRCHNSDLVNSTYSCNYCSFNTLSRQRMETHAVEHLRDQLVIHDGQSAQLVHSSKTS